MREEETGNGEYILHLTG